MYAYSTTNSRGHLSTQLVFRKVCGSRLQKILRKTPQPEQTNTESCTIWKNFDFGSCWTYFAGRLVAMTDVSEHEKWKMKKKSERNVSSDFRQSKIVKLIVKCKNETTTLQTVKTFVIAASMTGKTF